MKKDNCHVAHEAIKGKNVRKVKVYKPRKHDKVYVDEKIKTMVNEILNKYSYDKCLAVAGNSENIPASLLMLLVPTDSDELAVWNIDYHYRMYKNGDYDAYEFMCRIESLFDSLSKEFDDLIEFFLTGRIKRKEENGYERT